MRICAFIRPTNRYSETRAIAFSSYVANQVFREGSLKLQFNLYII